MTTFLLIRHGSNAAVGKHVVGRLPGIHLDEQGAAQASRLARRLARERLTAVCSSPLERAMETAAPIARAHGLEVEVRPAITELDFGEWTGMTFDELQKRPEWRRFNRLRSCTRIPGGELMTEVQVRAITDIERLQRAHPSGTLVMVSHGDVIRAALAHYAAISIDHVLRLEIRPASISTVRLGDGDPEILGVNVTESSAA